MPFCNNCGKTYKTGLFIDEQEFVKRYPNSEEAKELMELYDEVCPFCGCYPPATFFEWVGFKLHKLIHRKEK